MRVRGACDAKRGKRIDRRSVHNLSSTKSAGQTPSIHTMTDFLGQMLRRQRHEAQERKRFYASLNDINPSKCRAALIAAGDELARARLWLRIERRG